MYKFRKEERLCSLRGIEALVSKGSSRNFFPLRVVVLKRKETSEYPIRFLVSVPKKRIRSAVKRNRIKRVIREAWRLNKHYLYAEMKKKNKYADVMWVWTGKEKVTLKDLQSLIPAVFNYLLVEINKD